jgi:hypothetical protein
MSLEMSPLLFTSWPEAMRCIAAHRDHWREITVYNAEAVDGWLGRLVEYEVDAQWSSSIID